MRRSKAGLADLKALRRKVSENEETSTPEPVKQRIARKRSPFLPPSDRPATAAADQPAPNRRGDASPLSKRSPTPTAPATSGTVAPDLLDESDRRLFLHAVRYVDKIKNPGRILLPPVNTAPASILKERRRRAAGEEDVRSTRAKPKSQPAPERDSPAPAGRKRTTRLSDTFTPAGSEQDDRQYLRTGHGPDVLRDLKRGKWSIGASLDLHGSTVDDARERFERFVTSCLTHDVKCVRIVHGKGIGSPNGDAVLKAAVRRWLTQLPEVIAYAECSPSDGGSGAVQVLLS